MNTGITTRCTICDAELHGHNLTGLCRECKLILRNVRLTAPPRRSAIDQHDVATATGGQNARP